MSNGSRYILQCSTLKKCGKVNLAKVEEDGEEGVKVTSLKNIQRIGILKSCQNLNCDQTKHCVSSSSCLPGTSVFNIVMHRDYKSWHTMLHHEWSNSQEDAPTK